MSKKQQERLRGSGQGVGEKQVCVGFHKQKTVFQEGGNHLLSQVVLISEMRTRNEFLFGDLDENRCREVVR